MSEVIVVAPPAAHGLARKLAADLSAFGVSADAPDVSAHWTESGWRGMAAAWPQGAFIAFCLSDAFANEPILNDLIWRLTPIDLDPTGRFLFVFFEPALAAVDKYKTFSDLHFSAYADDASDVASHVKSYRQALHEALQAVEARRRADAENPRVLREPEARPAPSRPPGIGAGYSDAPARMPRPAPQAPAAPAPAAPPAETRSGLDRDGVSKKPRSSIAYEEGYAAAGAAPPDMQSTEYASGIKYSARKRERASAPAKLDKVDSMAFAPKKLRRGTSELIRVAIFQPKDRGRAMKAAKIADPRAQLAGVQALGEIERGATVSAVLDARGAEAEIERLDAQWQGEPLDFNFPIMPHEESAQALITIRILVGDAQIGAITFARPIIKARKDGRASKLDTREKLRRVNRVFLSYSSNDRTPVSLIASAYQRAGVQCFFDRTALKSGEEWSPRLRGEIERADLFHLCWSRNAAASEWVERETTHAMTKRRKTGGAKPDITIQMLDGPPWAPHPQSLDALNFDDYARAAIVGYARGDGA